MKRAPIMLMIAGLTSLTACTTIAEFAPPGGEDGGEPEPAPDQRLTSWYAVSSDLDIEGGLDPQSAAAARSFATMADEPNDPAKWVIDQLEVQLGGESMGAVLDALRPLRGPIDGTINTLITQNAPALRPYITSLGGQLDQMLQTFGLESNLIIGQDGAVRHELIGYRWEVDGKAYLLPAVIPGTADNVAEVSLTFDGSTARISEHTFRVGPASRILDLVEQIMIPEFQPGATSVGELLLVFIDCAAIGQTVNGQVPIVPASTVAGLCEQAILIGSDLLMQGVRQAIGDLELAVTLRGEAQAIDTDGDGAYDALQGTWRGTADLAGIRSTLDPASNTFTATGTP